MDIWPYEERHFFREREIRPILQEGPTCVSYCLAMMTGQDPRHFIDLMEEGKLNIQDPRTWSDALRPFGMKLAYVPSDIRKMRYYLQDLIDTDDLFALCYYSSTDPKELLKEPDTDGWLTSSHIVLLQGDMIYDSKTGEGSEAWEHECCDCHTKRMFRVVPWGEMRGL